MKQNKTQSGLLSNWQVKILSFVLALITVFIVYYAGQQTRSITLPLEVIFPENYTVASNVPQSADLVIQGSEKQIYMFKPENFSLKADFSDVSSEGVSSALIKVEVKDYNENLNLSDVTFYASPSLIRIYFEAK